MLHCSIDVNHRKGRIGKWQQKRQPKKHPRRRPRRKLPRKSSGTPSKKGNTLKGTLEAFPLVFLGTNVVLRRQMEEADRLDAKEENAMTRRRWIAERWDEATAAITGAQAAHMARVLRAEAGMEADVVAGGHVFHAVVAAVSPDEVRFNLVAEVQADPALPVTLVVAVYKFDHMEWAIEKATELGVAALAPVIAQRTEKHLAQAAEKRAERWRRIAHEAAQQSRRSDVPVIHNPTPLATRVKAASEMPRIVLAEQERTTTLRRLIEEAVEAAGEEPPALVSRR